MESQEQKPLMPLLKVIFYDISLYNDCLDIKYPITQSSLDSSKLSTTKTNNPYNLFKNSLLINLKLVELLWLKYVINTNNKLLHTIT